MHINDHILAATGGPTVNDGLLAWYKARGATSNNLIDAEREFLLARGVADGHLSDMWFKYLGGLGHTGSLSDRKYQFWSGGGII